MNVREQRSRMETGSSSTPAEQEQEQKHTCVCACAYAFGKISKSREKDKHVVGCCLGGGCSTHCGTGIFDVHALSLPDTKAKGEREREVHERRRRVAGIKAMQNETCERRAGSCCATYTKKSCLPRSWKKKPKQPRAVPFMLCVPASKLGVCSKSEYRNNA